eukprot:Blabericola_migrator_1__7337@NODE_372_length_9256_cov_73_169986_g297_i0_p4_GENE_NODE_372_length_9256_cov_73_169986_g297_i0NODE_372_length_9256_cov_73_169986_g297_i0_p4_ORF_typecomplete_len378_score50_63Phos_pyr_kin/PF08543_12/5_3e21PfkB/PF00294_24/0_0024_NODE_372_length_9256_cov_73_169986_g297_i080039136
MIFRQCLSIPAKNAEFTLSEGHILSVQSHVARDYVGNRASGLTLQLLGHEVDIVNTVSYSSMYVHEGSVLNEKDFDAMLAGLSKAIVNPKGSGVVGASEGISEELTNHDIPVVMAGYIGNPQLLRQLSAYVNRLRALPCTAVTSRALQEFLPFMKDKSVLYVMDPVIGDNGRPYVTPAMRAQYRENLSSADIILPNEFELNWVLGEEHFGQPLGQLPELSHIIGRINACHSQGVPMIFLTSCRLAEIPSDKMLAVTSVRQNDQSIVILCLFPRLDAYLGGAGDVLSALVVHLLLTMAKRNAGAATSADYNHLTRTVIGTLQSLMRQSIENGDISINVVKRRSILASTPDLKAIKATTVTSHQAVSIATLSQALKRLN